MGNICETTVGVGEPEARQSGHEEDQDRPRLPQEQGPLCYRSIILGFHFILFSKRSLKEG